ncbi:hypothetical protein BH10PSE3_BH10PSE3_15410 [soil metagenome]
MSVFRCVIGGVAVMLSMLLGAAVAVAKQAPPASGDAMECKIMNAMSGDVVVPVKVCRSPNGVWRRVEKDFGGQGAFGFKGRMIYSGRFEGSVGRVRTQSLSVNTRGLRFKLDNIGSYLTDVRQVAGASNVRIAAAGGEVTATFDLRGDGASRYLTLRGRAESGRCELTDQSGDARFSGRCDGSTLSGVLKVEDRSGSRFEVAVSAPFKSRQSVEQAALEGGAERQRVYEAKAEQAANLRRYAEQLTVQGTAGDPEAMYTLGQLYDDPDFADPRKSLYWYGKAVENNHPGAMFNLGVAYWNGDGVQKNTTMASNLFLRCAKISSKTQKSCAKGIGVAYIAGEGVAESQEKGIYWLKYCAKLGDPKCDQLLNSIR